MLDADDGPSTVSFKGSKRKDETILRIFLGIKYYFIIISSGWLSTLELSLLFV